MAEVTVHLNTKGRPEYATAMLASLFAQSYTDWDLIVYDGSAVPITEHEHFARMLSVIRRDHNVEYKRDQGLGIPQTYEMMRKMTKTRFAFREEDDILFESDCLEILMRHAQADEGGGAWAPSTPGWAYSQAPHALPDPVPGELIFENGFYRATRTKDVPGFEDGIWCADDAQCRWYPDADPNQAYEVCTIHAGAVYRMDAMEEAGGFSHWFSPVGHREETHAWCRLHMTGWKLYVVPAARLWHFEATSGGSRENPAGSPERRVMQVADEQVFQTDFAQWIAEDRTRFKFLNGRG